MEEILKEINAAIAYRKEVANIDDTLKIEHINLSTTDVGKGLIDMLQPIIDKHNLGWWVTRDINKIGNVELIIYKR